MAKIDEADDEQEMGFFDHIDVLRWHILRSVIAIILSWNHCLCKQIFIFDFLIFGPTRPDFPTNRAFCRLVKVSFFVRFVYAKFEIQFH